jgi:hypothetical protein
MRFASSADTREKLFLLVIAPFARRSHCISRCIISFAAERFREFVSFGRDVLAALSKPA